MKLDGAVVIVTGSAGAMGGAIARALGRHGATVACTDVDEPGLNTTVAAIEGDGGRSFGLPADVTDRGAVEAVVAETVKRFGRIDALINNAAVFRALGAVDEVDPEEWWRDVTVNLLGPFLFCRAVLPHMVARDSGVILNMSGGGFGGPVPGGSGYACSKTALIRLTETIALELGSQTSSQGIAGRGHHIHALAVEPAFVDSTMTRTVAHDPLGQRWLPFVETGLEAGEARSPNDVGQAICVVLASDTEALSGLVWVYTDDVDHLARNAGELRAQGLYRLAVRFAP